MKKTEYWKTILCKELALSGSYIYNGLKTFDEMESFYYEEEIFEFLYAISIGIERLQKIAIILKENIPPDEQQDFEKGLITHNHLELMKRITMTEQKDISSLSYDFLQLLSKFYKSWRYDRFSFSTIEQPDKEKQAFISFIEKYLNIRINNDVLFVSSNEVNYKRFIGRTIGKIVDYLYEIIKRECSRLNIYTYEIRIDTKAFKIFIRKEYDFINEDIFWKELLIYILHNVDDNDFLQFYKQIEPLPFDDGLLVSMIKSLKSNIYKLEHLEHLECLYDEVENKKERFEFLDLIGNEGFCLYNDDEIEETDL